MAALWRTWELYSLLPDLVTDTNILNSVTNQSDSSPLQSFIFIPHSVRQPCPHFHFDISLHLSLSFCLIALLPLSLLSSVLTFLSRWGSRSQCKGAAVPGSPCVCLHFLLHGSPPSPILHLFIAQLSLLSLHCIMGKKDRDEREGAREGGREWNCNGEEAGGTLERKGREWAVAQSSIK